MTLAITIAGLILGILMALAGSLSAWLGGVLGAVIGFLLGQIARLESANRMLSQRLEASDKALASFRNHFDRVTTSIHERFVALEKAPPEQAPPPLRETPRPQAAAMAQEVARTSDTLQPVPDVSVPPAAPSEAALQNAPELTVVPMERAPADLAAPATALPAPDLPEPAQPTDLPAGAPALATEAVLPTLQEEVPEAAPVSTKDLVLEQTGWEEVRPRSRMQPTPPPQHIEPPEPPEPSALENAIAYARDWLFGGNTLVRVGILLLFLGLAFLLRYAAERTTVPVEFRYAGVAAAALALLIVGWRVRISKPTYGLLLQGAAVGVMYLTTFAAMRLHPLIPVQGGFVLLVAIAALSALLAIRQDAASLAIAGTLGGFAAPVLASTGHGSHVALFSYFLLLNAGVLTIAWFKAWRTLNIVGFVGTFGIAMVWGARSFRPELFGSTEPFLIAFFLMYVSITVLFARRRMRDWEMPEAGLARRDLLRQSLAQTHAIDGSLLFGVPLIGFGLQHELVKPFEFGLAFSALALGLFYLLLARSLFNREQPRYLLLVETFLSLGVIFATLAIPLALDSHWTSAAWAVEGAGIYWISERQKRPLAQLFALLLQFGAVWYFLPHITLPPPGAPELLHGSWLGSAMIAASLLSNFRLARLKNAFEDNRWPSHLFALGGLAFIYLIAPLVLGSSGTAVAWALAGLLTVWVALKLSDGAWMLAGIGIQLAAGVVFFAFNGAASHDTSRVFAAGNMGLMVCALIGLSALFSVFLTSRKAEQTPELGTIMGLMLIFSLALINVAVLFVLPWQLASGVWAASGLLLVWLALHLGLRVPFWFGLALLCAGGFAYLSQLLTFSFAPSLPAFGHSGFWVPLVIGLAAWVATWRIHVRGRAHYAGGAGPLNYLGLIWGALWWIFAWQLELLRVTPAAWHAHLAHLLCAATISLWALAARRWHWQESANLCLGLTPVAALLLAAFYTSAPLSGHGGLAWGVLAATHFLTAYLLTRGPEPLWRQTAADLVHAAGCWLILVTLALQARHVFEGLGDANSSWRWLGWALVPALYLGLMSRLQAPRWWPLRTNLWAYRSLAAQPVAAVLVCWIVVSNIQSDGAAAPLPYIPLANPLELAYGLILLTLWSWARAQTRQAGQTETPRALSVSLLAIIFLCYTCGIARLVHHVYGVPFEASALFGSMILQAGLSIAWSVAALAWMIRGHRLQQRGTWICGATLVAIVVAKLFLIELSNRGGIERIISFIGVGLLLLVVGYFAPLPPRQAAEETPAP